MDMFASSCSQSSHSQKQHCLEWVLPLQSQAMAARDRTRCVWGCGAQGFGHMNTTTFPSAISRGGTIKSNDSLAVSAPPLLVMPGDGGARIVLDMSLW